MEFVSIEDIDMVGDRVQLKWNDNEKSWIPVSDLIVGRDSLNIFIERLLDQGCKGEQLTAVINWVINNMPKN